MAIKGHWDLKRKIQKDDEMNIIFIMLDSLRQDHVGTYNRGRKVFPDISVPTTPNIDKFAQSCVIFDNVYPCGLPTIPVRYELMCGHYSLPYRDWKPLNEYDVSISSILNREGYISGLVSDTYHYRAPGMNYHRDFDVYRWIRGQEYDPSVLPLPKRKVEDYVNKNYSETWKRRIAQFLANTDELNEENWFTQQVVEESANFLKKARSSCKNTLLWLDSFEPHEPWNPPKKFDIYTDKNYKGPRLIMPMGGEAKNWANESEIKYIRGLYAGEVSFVDHCLGRLFRTLEELDYFEDSLIILTADHGHPLADHGKFLKGTDRMYSELLKVPFLMRFPKGKYGGERIKTLIQFPDVLPTILDILSFSNNTIPLSGKSFYPIIKGEKGKHRDAIISGFYRAVERCIRDEKWSYVQTPDDQPDLLFNLEKDCKETTNLIDKYPEIAKHLTGRFGNIFRRHVSGVIKGVQGTYEMGSASID